MAGYSDFSFTLLWARVGIGADKALAASGNAPRGVVVDLPEMERAALAAQIKPHLDGLEALRLQTLSAVDSRARLLVPLVGGGVFVALLIGGQAVSASVLFGALGAVAGWFIAMGNRAGIYQAAVKARFRQRPPPTINHRPPGGRVNLWGLPAPDRAPGFLHPWPKWRGGG